MKQIYVPLILCILTLPSCNLDLKAHLKTAILLSNIDKYNQSVFINDISDIEKDDDCYYFVDNSIGSIFKQDSNLEYIDAVNNHGRGPKEYLSCNNLEIINDRLYVSDYIGNSIHIYNKQSLEYIEKVKLPKDGKITVGEFAIDLDKTIYVQSLNSGFNILCYNALSKEEHFLGKKNSKTHYSYSDIASYKKDLLIAIPFYSNKIHIYNKENTEFFLEIALPFSRKVIRKWEEYMHKSNGKTPLILDLQVHNEILYIVYQDFGKSKVIAKTIIDDKLKPHFIELISLKEKNGDRVINVEQGKIVSYAVGPKAIQLYSY